MSRRAAVPEWQTRSMRHRASQAMCERRLRAHPADADAHYQVGAAYGYLASYAATVEGRVFGSRAARRAYSEHGRVLELDPARKDAGLIVGMYRYAVSELSVPLRLFADLSGFRGGREHGAAPDRRRRTLPERRPVERALHAHPPLQPRGPLRRCARRDSAVAGVAIRATGCSGSRRAARRCERNDRPRRGSGSRRASPNWRAIRGRGRLARRRRWRYTYGAALVALKDTPARRTRTSRGARRRDARLGPWTGAQGAGQAGRPGRRSPARADEYRRPAASAARTRIRLLRGRSEGVAQDAVSVGGEPMFRCVARSTSSLCGTWRRGRTASSAALATHGDPGHRA